MFSTSTRGERSTISDPQGLRPPADTGLLRALDRDAIRHALRLHGELGASPLGERLGAIGVGPSDAWEILKYEVLDLLYASYFDRPRPPRGGVLRAIARSGRWLGERARFDLAVAAGVLDGGLWPAGRALEGLQTRWRSRLFGEAARAIATLPPIDVLFCGYLRCAPTWLGAPSGDADARRSWALLWRDDYFGRFRARVAATRIAHRTGASLLRADDYRRGRVVERRVETALRRAARDDGAPIAFVPGLRRYLSPPRLARFVRRVAEQHVVTERVLDARSPSLVVVPDEREPLAGAVARSTRRRGIPTISVPEVSDQLLRRFPPLDDVNADPFVVMSGAVADHFCRAGLPRARVAVMEFPGVARRTSTAPDAAPAADPERTARRRRSILFACQASDDEIDLVRRLARVVADLGDADLIVRPHPTQSAALLRAILRGHHVTRDGTVADAIGRADVVVTQSSTLAVDAAVLGRPVVVWNQTRCPELLPLLLRGDARWAPDAPALARALRSR